MKLVREHINEIFTDESDPIDDIGIGLRHFIIKWLKENTDTIQPWIYEYEILPDNTININGSIRLLETVKKLPKYIKFNRVSGDFVTSIFIESCVGFPEIIGKNLGCIENRLKSLKGFPKKIGGFCSLGGFTKEQVRKICDIGRGFVGKYI
jgi:hypothetical protein